MSSLYDIDQQLQILEEYMIDPETGEMLDENEFNKKFDEIQMALNEKIESTMLFYKSLTSESDAIKAEEKNLAQRRKVKEVLAERLKKRIDNYITHQFTDDDGNVDIVSLNKYKFETSRLKLSYRKSESVDVPDATLVPQQYQKVKTEITADKTAIKKAIKSGENIQGATLVTQLNMQVK